MERKPTARVALTGVHISTSHRSFQIFSKAGLSDCSFHRSLQKSERAIALFVALFERAIEQSRINSMDIDLNDKNDYGIAEIDVMTLSVARF